MYVYNVYIYCIYIQHSCARIHEIAKNLFIKKHIFDIQTGGNVDKQQQEQHQHQHQHQCILYILGRVLFVEFM